ncbi:SET domain containing protein [Aphelenchoides avenae]|nr:SET domain containing protein [Aphelenchus avenae]
MDVESFLSLFLSELELAQRVGERNRRPPQLNSITCREDIIARHAEKFLEQQMISFGFAKEEEQHVKSAVITGTSHCCKTALDELRPITLSDMEVPKVHKGRYCICRTISEPLADVAVTVVVEDINGDVVEISLHNCLLDLSNVTWLPSGTIIVIKEPHLKFTADEDTTEIYVESPSDVVFVDPTDFDALETFGASKWHFPEQYSSEELSRFAKKYVDRNDLDTALKYYDRALRVGFADAALHLDRCDVLLRLERFYEVYESAKTAYKCGADEEASLYRMSVAAYKMRNWKQAASHLQELISISHSNKLARALLASVTRRLDESCEGKYDIRRMYMEAYREKRRYLDVADYVGPVETADISGKGKGLVASKAISKGTLLMVSKAFACTYPDEHPGTLVAVNLITDQRDDKAQFFNKVRAVQTLLKGPHRAAELYSLYAGNLPRDACIPFGVVDVARIEKICAFNSFQMNYHDTEEGGEGDPHLSETPTSLFIMPSFLNHACIGNAYRSFYGDVMVIHAIGDLRKGDEVVFSYTDPLKPFKERSKQLLHFGIYCDCQLCELDKIDPRLQEREELAAECDELSPMLENNPPGLVKTLKPMIAKIRDAYEERKELQLQLIKPLLLLAAAYSSSGHYVDSTDALDECLQCVRGTSLYYFYGPAIYREMSRCYEEAGLPAEAALCMKKAAECLRVRSGIDEEAIREILSDPGSLLP